MDFSYLNCEGYSHIYKPICPNEQLKGKLVKLFTILALCICEQVMFFNDTFDPLNFNYKKENPETLEESEILELLDKYCIYKGIEYSHFSELIQYYNIKISRKNYLEEFDNGFKNEIKEIIKELNEDKENILLNCEYSELYELTFFCEEHIINRLNDHLYSKKLILNLHS